MFVAHCTQPANQQIHIPRADAILTTHPLQLTAFLEDFYRTAQQNMPNGTPADAWPAAYTAQIEAAFAHPAAMLAHYAIPALALYPHFIYAFCIENTKIYDVFFKVLQAYRTGETIGVPGAASRRFWQTTESLIYSDPPPTTVWSTTSRARPDEVADRASKYWTMFGLELGHAADVMAAHPYVKADAANTEFRPHFESMVRETWRGLVNARNRVGPNDVDDGAISARARRLNQMLTERNQNGNLSREMFRAVYVHGWLHLAVSYDSPVVVDLGATKGATGAPGDRLASIAEKVGMQVPANAQALFELAQPASELLWLVESGTLNTIPGARQLYRNARQANIMRTVMAQYETAMGADLKATRVTTLKPAMALKPATIPAQQANGQPARPVVTPMRPVTVPAR
jgi:hypothetical protein